MEPLGSILSKLNFRGPGPLRQRQILEAVQTALEGATDDDLVRVGMIRRNTLTLEVSSAAKAFEWRGFFQEQLLGEIRKVAGLEQLQEVRIKVGSWRKHDRG